MTEPESWWQAHQRACASGHDFYNDPDSGYRVMTADFLRQRGNCCGCGCRHCPWSHEAIPFADRPQRISRPAFLHGSASTVPATVLFWSGGKDSYLTLLALREHTTSIVLLTTFDPIRKVVAHQEIGIETIAEQARALQLPLIGVPLFSDIDYVEQIAGGLSLQPQITDLAFGDLHLEHIRQWRDEALTSIAQAHNASIIYPLWHADYSTLARKLDEQEAGIFLSAVDTTRLPHAQVGQIFDQAFRDQLPSNVDAFGENGEFHTVVTFGTQYVPECVKTKTLADLKI